ncbi:hypothetical protein M431DRAFT_10020 [Trichoderma harzianum CBS 226.95]|uniref:non-specific serine/threonine protein kinase n=1 Tax=Trichoderma harzianum CBS 226.95 TaxID=983964 RepID=A0A2T3ZX97_TRIHA|nr:hypothetical protein M431DRAFT_10020 [Trichoderma harzianum CBS 226.95]PTB49435.1 hypothetical protein M431DRAFT_10020 [Trichoderma harzianum CBS 226.95]
MPLVPQPFSRVRERDQLSVKAKLCLRFLPVIRTSNYQSTLSAQQVEIIKQRASKLHRRANNMKLQESSEFSWEVCAWHDVFGLILDDEWFKMDKRKYKFVEEDADKKKIVKARIPDATFGLTTYDPRALYVSRDFLDAGHQADYSNKQPDDRLSQHRLKSMTNNTSCSLVVDGVWGDADLVFPFAVYEAKKRTTDHQEAKQQIQHACQIYLSMLDDLARNPDNVAEYQSIKSPHSQMFAFASHGSQWAVYVAWTSKETCNIELLWTGDVASLTNASDLICIVDQIHDYAVKHHRPYVLDHLAPWLTWSEKRRDNVTLIECLKSKQRNWWCLEYDMSLIRKSKLRQARERRKKARDASTKKRIVTVQRKDDQKIQQKVQQNDQQKTQQNSQQNDQQKVQQKLQPNDQQKVQQKVQQNNQQKVQQKVQPNDQQKVLQKVQQNNQQKIQQNSQPKTQQETLQNSLQNMQNSLQKILQKYQQNDQQKTQQNIQQKFQQMNQQKTQQNDQQKSQEKGKPEYIVM